MTNTPPTYQANWGRFFFHWFFNTLGVLFKFSLPILKTLEDPAQTLDTSRIWVLFLESAIIGVAGGGINCSLPILPGEALRSIATGFALDNTASPFLRPSSSKQKELQEMDAKQKLQRAYDLAARDNFKEAIEKAKEISNNPEISPIYEKAQTKIQAWEKLIKVQEMDAHKKLQQAYDLAVTHKYKEAIEKAKEIPNNPEVSYIYKQAQIKIKNWEKLIQISRFRN